MINNIPESNKWINIAGGKLWWKFEIKTQDRTLSKNNNTGLVFYLKNPGPLCPWNLFLLMLIIWNIDIHTCLLDSTFLHGSWIYNYLCNQRLSPLMLWVQISIRSRCTKLCDQVCLWLATGRWFSRDFPVSSTNKTDHHDIAEILLKVALNTIKQTKFLKHILSTKVARDLNSQHQWW
jgi:hypothetical protein